MTARDCTNPYFQPSPFCAAVNCGCVDCLKQTVTAIESVYENTNANDVNSHYINFMANCEEFVKN